MAKRVAFDADADAHTDAHADGDTGAAASTTPMLSRRERLKQRKRNLVVAPVGRANRRSYRQTVTKIDLWSVLKLAICFYLGALVVVLVAAIALWEIASVAGVIDSVQNFMRDLLGSNDFTFLSWRILRGFTLLGLVIVSVGTIITVVAAAFYNLFAEMMGGVVITVVEEDEGR
ncbi:MAG TPA: DUF3566 domain-containing protein [Acidimicrobiia bacterium]|nr:DUF3566 domain-containing protein [Acidimicrobiia bacterium]